MAKVNASTQQFVEIKEIRDSVVYLKKGGLRQILMVSGINFDLKSEAEQNLILSLFQNFLNGLDFSIQFFIHSRKVNINQYLETIKERKTQEQNELLKIQIEEYMEFIKSFVEENAIVSKNFFVIVPYDPISLTGQTKGLLNIFQKNKSNSQKKEEDNIQKNIQQLNQRVNQVINGLEQIGLQAVPLDDESLIELFYNLYNPQLVDKKGLEIAKTSDK